MVEVFVKILIPEFPDKKYTHSRFPLRFNPEFPVNFSSNPEFPFEKIGVPGVPEKVFPTLINGRVQSYRGCGKVIPIFAAGLTMLQLCSRRHFTTMSLRPTRSYYDHAKKSKENKTKCNLGIKEYAKRSISVVRT